MTTKAKFKLKNKRTSDKLGWRRKEWLKERGKEIVKCLTILFNKIKRKQSTLTQWG